MIRQFCLATSLSLVAAACVGKEPIRTRWAQGSVPIDEESALRLSISSIPAEATSTKAKDLPERAGAAYLTALGAKTANADEYRAAASEGIKPTKRSDADRTVLNRTIAISLAKLGYSATRRLVETRVTIVPQNFRFAGYTMAKSEYQTVDLENVALTRTTTAKVGIAPEFGNLVEAAEASLTQENKEGTTYVNRERTEALSVFYQPDRVELYQRGTPGADLTGVILLSAAVRPVTLDEAEYETVVAEYKIVGPDGTDLPPAKASMTTVVDKLLRGKPLTVCAKVDFVERRATSGSQFIDEGRQVIQEVRGATVPKMFELVASDQVAPPLYGLVIGPGFVTVDSSVGRQSFSFTNELDAVRFASWMTRTGAAKIGPRQLYSFTKESGSQPLKVSRGRDVRVQTLQAPPEAYHAAPCAIATE